jgi:lysine 6-dehydrogenase
VKKVIVLGGGLVGGVMARDLADDKTLKVTLIDRDQKTLDAVARKAAVETACADLSDWKALPGLVKPYDLVVGAVPGFMGLRMLETVIGAGKDIVDISFMPEDGTALDKLARKRKVTAVYDCGVAPGMSNMLLGHVETLLDRMERGLILVGGLPVKRTFPFEYAAVFSPIDVIEEYTRTARYIEHGRMVEREALSDPEYVELPGVGTLEAFNTDGLRSLARTIKAPFLKEKTLRWPGHIEKMRVLRAMGLFSKEKIEVDGVQVRPLDVTAKLMFPLWKLKEGEEELTVMRVEAEGLKGGKRRKYTYDLLDRTDTRRGETSMARTTGFAATAVARLMLKGGLKKPGVHPPEVLGRDPRILAHVLKELKARGIVFKETIGK